MSDTRLIERWLPIAAIGEESIRERRSMTALPPIYSCPSGAEPALTAALQGPATRAGGLWTPPAEHRIGPQALHSDSRHPLNPGSIARPRPYDRLTAHTGADHGRPRRRTTRTSMPSYPLIHQQISPLPRTPSPFAAASVTLLLHCQGGSKTDRRFGSLSDRRAQTTPPQPAARSRGGVRHHLPVQLPCHDPVLSSSLPAGASSACSKTSASTRWSFHPDQGGGGTLARRLVAQVLT